MNKRADLDAVLVADETDRAKLPEPNTGQPYRILAAIDFRETAGSEVNDEIVRRAAQLATLMGGELHVATTLSAFPCEADPCRVGRYLPALRVKARNRRRCAIRQMLRTLQLEAAGIHVGEGPRRDAINALAADLRASVTVAAGLAGNDRPEFLVGGATQRVCGARSNTLAA